MSEANILDRRALREAVLTSNLDIARGAREAADAVSEANMPGLP